MLQPRREKLPGFLIPGLFLVYACLRVVSTLAATNKPRELTDTIFYLRTARTPLFDVKFWGGDRTWIFPLLLKIVHRSLPVTAALQLGFSILVWGLLAFQVARVLKTAWLKPIAFGAILLISLDRHIAGWDSVMLTESLSISFLVLFIALGLWLLQGWHISKVIALCITGLALAFTRDTNAWLILMLACILVLAVILRWTRPRTLLLAAFFFITFLLGNADANFGGRWVFPLGNLIGQRVLPDEKALAFFQACGMPDSPALRQLSGEFANGQDRALFEDPQLESFRIWFLQSGKSCYMRWLASDPANSLGGTLDQFQNLIAFSNAGQFFSRQYNPLLPVPVGQVIYPDRFLTVLWVLSTLAALSAIWKKWWRDSALWAVFICLNLLIFPHLFITWHGDAMAPERHALSVGVQFVLSLWILGILAVEQIWQKVLLTRRSAADKIRA